MDYVRTGKMGTDEDKTKSCLEICGRNAGIGEVGKESGIKSFHYCCPLEKLHL